MIENWRLQLFERSGCGEDYLNWLENQSWFEQDEEYSLLFEEIYDRPAQRRTFIEKCVTKAHPSWGYVYLADLLYNRFFDIVFTTIFDDLINEACFLYSDGLRPIVAAHDSSIKGIYIASERPKIVKLHGDFLFDNIKNSLEEVQTLEVTTNKKLSHFAKEYGMVVLGYSGRDRSVMDILEDLLEDDENYRYGVYWCDLPGATKTRRLQRLLGRDRVYLVEIDGFDQFAADLHSESGLEPPKAFTNPFKMAKDRARIFLNSEGLQSSHPVIVAHYKRLLENTKNSTLEIPLSAKASLLSSQRRFGEAVALWAQIYEEDPTDETVRTVYAYALADAGRNDELSEIVLNSEMSMGSKTYLLFKAGWDSEVLDLSNEFLNRLFSHEDDFRQDNSIVRINRAIALKRLGRAEEMMADLHLLEQNEGKTRIDIKAGITALKGDKTKLLALLHEHPKRLFTPRELGTLPVFEDYVDDPEFLKFIESMDED